MNLITYKSSAREHTIELGKRYNVQREGNCEDMVISRHVAIDCPLKVCLLIRTNGDLDVWYAEFSTSSNVYWHFDHLSDKEAKERPPTKAQVDAMTRLRDNVDIYGNLGGMLGADIIEWSFGERARLIADEYHN